MLTAGDASVDLPASLAKGLGDEDALLFVLAAHTDASFLGGGAEASRQLGHAVRVDVAEGTVQQRLGDAGLVVTLPALPIGALRPGQRLACAAWDTARRRWNEDGAKLLPPLLGSSRVRCFTSHLGILVAAVPAATPRLLGTVPAVNCGDLELQDFPAFLGDTTLFKTKVGVMCMLLVPVILFAMVAAGCTHDILPNRAREWSDGYLISEDPRFQTPESVSHGFSTAVSRVLLREPLDIATPDRAWETVQGCRALEQVLSCESVTPRADISLMLYHVRRTAEDATKASPWEHGKMSPATLLDLWPTRAKFREILREQEIKPQVAMLYARSFMLAHPMLQANSPSVSLRRYIRCLLSAFAMMIGFLVACVLLRYLGQGVVPREIPSSCEPDLNIAECLGIGCIGCVVSQICVVPLRLPSRRRFVFMPGWTPGKEKQMLRQWRMCDVCLSLFLGLGSLTCWLLMKDFIARISEQDGERCFWACGLIILEQWLLQPLFVSWYCTTNVLRVLKDGSKVTVCMNILGLEDDEKAAETQALSRIPKKDLKKEKAALDEVKVKAVEMPTPPSIAWRLERERSLAAENDFSSLPRTSTPAPVKDLEMQEEEPKSVQSDLEEDEELPMLPPVPPPAEPPPAFGNPAPTPLAAMTESGTGGAAAHLAPVDQDKFTSAAPAPPAREEIFLGAAPAIVEEIRAELAALQKEVSAPVAPAPDCKPVMPHPVPAPANNPVQPDSQAALADNDRTDTAVMSKSLSEAAGKADAAALALVHGAEALFGNMRQTGLNQILSKWGAGMPRPDHAAGNNHEPPEPLGSMLPPTSLQPIGKLSPALTPTTAYI